VKISLDFIKDLVKGFLDKILNKNPVSEVHESLIKAAKEISPEISDIITEKLASFVVFL
jgi:hypothetical protein